MPLPALAVPLGLGAASFIGGLLGKDRRTQNTTSRSMPMFDPAFGSLKDRVIQHAMRRLNPGANFALARNITNQRLQGVNDTARAASTGLLAKLAGRGVRGAAAGTAIGNLENQRFAMAVDTANQEPLLARQFDQEDFESALPVLGMGRGTSTVSEGTVEGGGGIGQGFADLGEMIGFLAANGAFGKSGGSVMSLGKQRNIGLPGRV